MFGQKNKKQVSDAEMWKNKKSDAKKPKLSFEGITKHTSMYTTISEEDFRRMPRRLQREYRNILFSELTKLLTRKIKPYFESYNPKMSREEKIKLIDEICKKKHLNAETVIKIAYIIGCKNLPYSEFMQRCARKNLEHEGIEIKKDELSPKYILENLRAMENGFVNPEEGMPVVQRQRKRFEHRGYGKKKAVLTEYQQEKIDERAEKISSEAFKTYKKIIKSGGEEFEADSEAFNIIQNNVPSKSAGLQKATMTKFYKKVEKWNLKSNN